MMPLTDDLDLETRGGARYCRRHVSQGQGMIDAMTEGAGCHPAHDLAVMPDGLIAQRIRVLSLQLEGQEPQSAAFPVFHCRGTANEFFLLEIHKSAEPGFERTVDRTVFARPGAEALFDSHAIERSTAEGPQV